MDILLYDFYIFIYYSSYYFYDVIYIDRSCTLWVQSRFLFNQIFIYYWLNIMFHQHVNNY